MAEAVAIRFTRAALLSDESSIAIEDYARAASGASRAEVLRDASGAVVGLQLTNGQTRDEVAQDIERFFESLSVPSPDRLGWR